MPYRIYDNIYTERSISLSSSPPSKPTITCVFRGNNKTRTCGRYNTHSSSYSWLELYMKFSTYLNPLIHPEKYAIKNRSRNHSACCHKYVESCCRFELNIKRSPYKSRNSFDREHEWRSHDINNCILWFGLSQLNPHTFSDLPSPPPPMPLPFIPLTVLVPVVPTPPVNSRIYCIPWVQQQHSTS